MKTITNYLKKFMIPKGIATINIIADITITLDSINVMIPFFTLDLFIFIYFS